MQETEIAKLYLKLMRQQKKPVSNGFNSAINPDLSRTERIKALRELGMNFTDARCLSNHIGREING